MDLSVLPRSIQWRLQLGVLQAVDPAKWNPAMSDAQVLELVFQENESTLQQQKEQFQKLIENHVEEEVVEEEGVEIQTEPSNSPQSPPQPEVDPLTAIVMEHQARETRKAELLLKYKKERARRKRGLTTEGKVIGDESDGIDRASLVIIEKDLKRLPHPTSNGGAASGNLSPAEETRIANLKEILYIYAQEHPTMGYRQGMHEIASYLMFILELEKQQYPDNPLIEATLPHCYFMLEKTLNKLHLAYDASGEQALHRMSHSILGKIHQNDPTLYTHLTSSPNIPPPPIYCTRWVRLLFSREVVGYENVFKLWDYFFQYSDCLMRALEVTSATRILLERDNLLMPDGNTLDQLMNIPQLSDTTELTSLSKLLMEQKDTDDPVPFPSSKPVTTSSMPQTPMRGRQGPAVGTPMPQTPHTTLPKSTPANHAAAPLSTPAKSSGNSNHNNFSFSKMRHSLGQKGESLRQKIVTATNEWKRDISTGSNSDLFGNLNNYNNPMSAPQSAHQQQLQPQSMSFGTDPLLHPPSTPVGGTVFQAPPSPRQHQHAKWSEVLKSRLYVVQQFLMTVEEQEKSKVPPEVWEAMSDIQRMQQELHNYSINMP